MAARGSYSKEQVTNKILEMFSGSFINGKEVRIPMIEDGNEIQIKVTLTAAKENISNPNACGDDNEVAGTVASADVPFKTDFTDEPTQEEKEKVKKLVEKLGIVTN